MAERVESSRVGAEELEEGDTERVLTLVHRRRIPRPAMERKMKKTPLLTLTSTDGSGVKTLMATTT
jgi:hypothetical protein